MILTNMSCDIDPYFCDVLSQKQVQVIQNVLEAVEDPKWNRFQIANATKTNEALDYLYSFGLELYCRKIECGSAEDYFFVRLMYELTTGNDGLIRAPYMTRDLMKKKLSDASGVIYGYGSAGQQAVQAIDYLVDTYYDSVEDPSTKMSKSTLRGRTQFVNLVCTESLKRMKKAMGSPLTEEQQNYLRMAASLVNKSKICTTYNANDESTDYK
jgi:hypothetical protein